MSAESQAALRQVPAENGTCEVLLFELGAERHALAAANVQEVVRAVAVTPLGGEAPALEGVFNLRGCIVPLIDLRKLLAMPAKEIEPGDQFIVAEAGPRLVALRCDHALGLARVDLVEPHGGEASAKGVAPGVLVGKDAQGGVCLVHRVESLAARALPAAGEAAREPLR